MQMSKNANKFQSIRKTLLSLPTVFLHISNGHYICLLNPPIQFLSPQCTVQSTLKENM